MPLYEFRCMDCGLIFEEIVFHEEVGNVLCPKCLGKAQKVLSTFSINVPDEVCGKLPRGEERELCTECREGGGACPFGA